MEETIQLEKSSLDLCMYRGLFRACKLTAYGDITYHSAFQSTITPYDDYDQGVYDHTP